MTSEVILRFDSGTSDCLRKLEQLLQKEYHLETSALEQEQVPGTYSFSAEGHRNGVPYHLYIEELLEGRAIVKSVTEPLDEDSFLWKEILQPALSDLEESPSGKSNCASEVEFVSAAF